jgi:hypothetical protein
MEDKSWQNMQNGLNEGEGHELAEGAVWTTWARRGAMELVWVWYGSFYMTPS